MLAFLLGVPCGIYFLRLRTGNTNARDLLIDCGAAVGLYLTALLTVVTAGKAEFQFIEKSTGACASL